MEKITGYEIRKEGYIEEDGTEHYDTQVYEGKTKQECVDYAIEQHLNLDEHFIQAIGYEMISGLKVPVTFDNGEYLYQILNTQWQQLKQPRS